MTPTRGPSTACASRPSCGRGCARSSIRSDALAAASAFRRMGVPLEEALELVKLAYEEAGE